jgi:hypothetical protein
MAISAIAAFAEDFRPDIFDSAMEYPGSCAYAVSNKRDLGNLVLAGLERDHVHYLPGPLAQESRYEPRMGYGLESARGRRTVLYPVVANRRKNIGEVLLI